jgi:hypothetical protein
LEQSASILTAGAAALRSSLTATKHFVTDLKQLRSFWKVHVRLPSVSFSPFSFDDHTQTLTTLSFDLIHTCSTSTPALRKTPSPRKRWMRRWWSTLLSPTVRLFSLVVAFEGRGSEVV